MDLCDKMIIMIKFEDSIDHYILYCKAMGLDRDMFEPIEDCEEITGVLSQELAHLQREFGSWNL